VNERTPTHPEPRVLVDARAIKALAHPARLTVLDALADGSELTATECAEAAGVSPSAMSYHLRALEKWGFVERAESSEDGRERPWRSVPGGWRVDSMPDRAAAAATTALLSTMFQRLQAEFARWTEHEPTEPAEWREATLIMSRAVWLTAQEAKELEQLYDGYLEERRGRTAKDHPAGARRVRAAGVVVPLQFE
jgi:DNA-binding transcriptional ArsR family regulator